MASTSSSAFSNRGYVLRVSVACVPCRERHRKCEGQRPICSQCQTNGSECFYKQSRRGRLSQDVDPNLLEREDIHGNQQLLNHTMLINPSALQYPQVHGALNLALAPVNSENPPYQSSDGVQWLSNAEAQDILAARNTETDPSNQIDESNTFRFPAAGIQQLSSCKSTNPSSTPRVCKLVPHPVNDTTIQRPSTRKFNRSHSSYPGKLSNLSFDLIAITSRFGHAPTHKGTSKMPMIVYGYGSWTVTASNGYIESISLGYGRPQNQIDTPRAKAFPAAGYFYNPPASQDTAHWLLPLLKRSEPLYHACVSLGLCHQLLSAENTRECQLDFSNELYRHHALSLKGLQQRIDLLPTPLGVDFVNNALDLLACIWQLLSIEMFIQCWRTTEGHWEMHWKALGTILSIMQPEYSKEDLSQQTSSEIMPYTGGQDLRHIEHALRQSPMSPDAVVLKYYVQCYAWADVLACATFGIRRPFANSFEYLQLLEDGRIDLCSLMGCHNEVMIIILKIAIFKDWKITMENRARLSLGDLVDIDEQSNRLEGSLNHELLCLLKERSHLKHQLEVDRSLITELHIRSALIYLHAILSGPDIHVPEIRAHVQKALLTVKMLPHRLILRISWPFCIAACMAVDEQQGQFRKIASDAMEAGYLIGTVVKAMKVAEECWRIRRASPQSSSGVDWMVAMESLGVRLLLI